MPTRGDPNFKFPYQLEYEGYGYYDAATKPFDINDKDTYWYNQMKDHYNGQFD